MKVSLCQINPILGNFKKNIEKIILNYKKALNKRAELIIFPEMAVCGYAPQDLIWDKRFVDASENAVDQIAKVTTKPLLIGFIRNINGLIYNSEKKKKKGKIKFVYDKILLPNYDVFDEQRYFTKGERIGITKINIDGESIKIGIQICEDLWSEKYHINISKKLSEAGVNFIVNLSASPFHDNQQKIREDLIKNIINDYSIPFIYCNLVGAQDELIFDGNSLVFDKKGSIIASGKSFIEDLISVDMNSNDKIVRPKRSRDQNLYDAITLGIKDYFQKTNHKKAIIGLSGGIDSALTASLAVDALGSGNVIGISMPSVFSSSHSIADAEKLAQNLKIELYNIPINNNVNQVMESLDIIFKGTSSNVAEENIQARIRGLILMAVANKFGWLVLSTGNKTELALGYCTLYGDMNGGLSVISDLSKQDVYSVSNWANKFAGYDRIPLNTISKPPSAELAPEQVDPFDYNIVSPLVESIIQENNSLNSLVENGYEPLLIKEVSRMIRINEYKRRQAAPGIRVTSKAFGQGRRYPVINQFYPEKDL